VKYEQMVLADDSQGPDAFSSTHITDDENSADIDVDDDDDVSFSARKKISFEITTGFDTVHFAFQYIHSISQGKFCSQSFNHLSPSRFISLRVFRI
jgi:hypothetical protein